MDTHREFTNGKFTKEEIEKIYVYFQELFPQTEDCYVKLFSKSTKHSKIYNIKSLKEKDKLSNVLNSFGKNNLMISSNTFKSLVRTTESNLFSINSICVDLDYKKIDAFKDLPPENIIKFLELDYFNTKIPNPNYIEYSNQIRLIYMLKEPIYIPKRNIAVRTLCNRVTEHFAEILKSEFGAEKQKSEKFIRVPYSINTKNLSEVKLLSYVEEHYELSEFQELWMNDVPDWYLKWKNKKRRKVKRTIHYNPSNTLSFNQKRLSDFKKIQEYLNRNDIDDYKNRLCFLYHNYSLLIHLNNNEFKGEASARAVEDMLIFNEHFKTPAIGHKLISDTKFLRKKQYKYGNKTLMDLLDLTDELCKSLKLETIFDVKEKRVINKEYYIKNKSFILNNRKKYYIEKKEEISSKKKEKYINKLHNQGKLTKKEEQELLMAKIKDLLAKGLKQKHIANELGLSLSTIKRYISVIKKAN